MIFLPFIAFSPFALSNTGALHIVPPTGRNIFFNTAKLFPEFRVFKTVGVSGDMIEAEAIGTAPNWSNRTQMTEETATEVPDADAQLMLRFKEGDAEAFEHLFLRHTRAIINFAYRFVRNREVAEELAQEIFLRVYEGVGGYEPRAKFTTWLYRIATNVCLNEIRKPHFRARHMSLTITTSHEADAAIVEPATADKSNMRLVQQAIAQAIRQALEQIPLKQRIAFILNKYQELSYSEVAEIMRISEKAVKSLIHRAKETLAGKLKPSLPGLLNI
jgi:RNA polymerase sigma-70 factor (ECF subfamily)